MQTPTTGYKMTAHNWGRFAITLTFFVLTLASGWDISHDHPEVFPFHIFFAIGTTLLVIRIVYSYVKER